MAWPSQLVCQGGGTVLLANMDSGSIQAVFALRWRFCRLDHKCGPYVSLNFLHIDDLR